MSDSPIRLAPSMIAADLSRIGEVIAELEAAGISWLHWDVMDGVFVPNLSFGPMVIAAARPLTSAHFDVHLMIQHPEKWIAQFADAGADSIDIHAEGCNLAETIPLIKSRGPQCGVVIDPETSVETIRSCLPEVDNVIVMTVQPGFGGQRYLPTVTPKIAELAHLKSLLQLDFEIIVDGGISPETAPIAARAGATVLVCGASSVFVKGYSVAENVAAMRRSLGA